MTPLAKPPHSQPKATLSDTSTEAMASRIRTLKIPPDLAEIADMRAKQLGYDSWALYIKSLIRFDSMCGSSHTVTVPWSKEPLPVQDQIDAKLLKRLKEGKGMTSQEAKNLDWKTGL